MTIDWNLATPESALAGGMLIGLAVAMMVLLKGRITGISGIIGGLLRVAPEGGAAWRLAFIGGMLAAPVAYGLFAALPNVSVESGPLQLIVAGLLVGYGSRLGSGCTSGHGVCGLSRLSPRALAATMVFMGTGTATVFVLRHLLS